MAGRGRQRSEDGLHRFPHVLSGVIECPDDQVLKRLDIAGVNDARVDAHGHHLAVPVEGDLNQPAAGLTLHLGLGDLLLGREQVLLHMLGLGQCGLQIAQGLLCLLCLLGLLGLAAESTQVTGATGCNAGLHDGLLASWSRLRCTWRFIPPMTFQPRRRGITVTPVLKIASMRVVAATSAGLLLAASSLAAPATQAAPGSVAGMIVFLDPGHNGANDASMTRQVPTGRGGTKDCQTSGTNTESGYAEHTFNWDTVLRIRAALSQFGVRTAMSRGNDDAVGPCVDERAAMANALQPNAVVSIHGDGGPATGRGFHILYSNPPLNAAQAGPSIQFARMMRNQLSNAGIPPSTYLGSDGLNPRSDIAGLNLAQYPSILVELGNMKNPLDSTLMESEEGRQKYANAVAQGVVAFLQTQPPRTT